jgi:hypothetical protein
MGSSSESKTWLDRWWLLLLILFGVGFILILALFSPMH